MKNYIQPGDVVTVTAPTGGVTSGAGVLIGALFGVAATTQSEGDDVEIATRGVFDLAKFNGTDFAVGDEVYFDTTTKRVGDHIGTGGGDARIGVAVLAASTSATTVRVRLDGVTIT